MCHQTVGLVGAALEAAGIVTASVSLVPEITARVRPPRSLAVPYRLGYPFGEPHDAALQRRVLTALLELCRRDDVPVLAAFDPGP